MELGFDGRVFARYVPDGTPRPYLDRLSTVDGVPLLRELGGAPLPDGSDDHPHHRGVWWGHRAVNGADIWTEFAGHGSIVSLGPVTRHDSPTTVTVAHDAVWLDSSGAPLLTEHRVVRAHRPGADGTQALDLEGTIEPTLARFDGLSEPGATAGAVTLADTKEAGLVAVRVTPELEERRGGRIQTSEGAVGEARAWGRPARWCAYAGRVGAAEVGLAVLDHPSNPGHPVHWHVRDYGLLAANPFGLSDFPGGESADGTMILEPGERVTFRHRLLTFSGPLDSAVIDEHAERYGAS